MNAYELADLIDSEDTLWLEGRLGDICNMLRQQADRIAELEKEIGIQAWLSQTKPLEPKEIETLAENCWYSDEDLEIFNYQKFAFLLQERHGIK